MSVGLVHYLESEDGKSYLGFWCPGCRHAHVIPFINAPPPSPPGLWCYDGNPLAPTISPSLRVMTLDGKGTACHVVITNGILHFCPDSAHDLKGQSVKMQEWVR